MDWTALNNNPGAYKHHFSLLDFSPENATCVQVESDGSDAHHSTELLSPGVMPSWLTKQFHLSSTAKGRPYWRLTVLMLQRGLDGSASARSDLSHVGCMPGHLEAIFQGLNAPKAVLASIFNNESYYTRNLEMDPSGQPSHISFILRGGPACGDMVFSLHHSLEKATTSVLILGCSMDHAAIINRWLVVMKEHAGHPLLMVALFLEVQKVILQEQRTALLVSYTAHYRAVFEIDTLTQEPKEPSGYREKISNVNRLDTKIDDLDTDLTALRLQVSDVVAFFEQIPPTTCSATTYDVAAYGNRLKNNLTQLGLELECLQAKTAMLRGNVELLISSIWSAIAMNENEISKKLAESSQTIATAGKRDSSIMLGITVGTMTFFPSTTIATIFAIPIFNWDAPKGHNVADHRFGYYLAVTIPLTILTLLSLALWMVVSDKASREKLSTRDYIKKLSMKEKIHKYRNRFPWSINRVRQISAEKVSTTSSPPYA